jgi:hypothetical protein
LEKEWRANAGTAVFELICQVRGQYREAVRTTFSRVAFIDVRRSLQNCNVWQDKFFGTTGMQPNNEEEM